MSVQVSFKEMEKVGQNTLNNAFIFEGAIKENVYTSTRFVYFSNIMSRVELSYAVIFVRYTVTKCNSWIKINFAYLLR